jgi:hypothetical protein
MSKTGSITSPCWEVIRRLPDRRMRSPSVEGGDNITLPERGPLGPVGTALRRAPHIEADTASRPRRFRRQEPTTLDDREGRIRLNPGARLGRLLAEPRGGWSLKPYWGKPNVRNFREGGWKHDHGSRTEAHRESVGMATGPYRACASALPDRATVGTDPSAAPGLEEE